MKNSLFLLMMTGFAFEATALSLVNDTNETCQYGFGRLTSRTGLPAGQTADIEISEDLTIICNRKTITLRSYNLKQNQTLTIKDDGDGLSVVTTTTYKFQ